MVLLPSASSPLAVLSEPVVLLKKRLSPNCRVVAAARVVYQRVITQIRIHGVGVAAVLTNRMRLRRKPKASKREGD